MTNLGMVAHTCNLSTWESEAEGSRVPDQHGVHGETLSQKKKMVGKDNGVDMVVYTYNPSHLEGIDRRITSKDGSRQKVSKTLSKKMTKAKKKKIAGAGFKCGVPA
jgi:hypothetical protein